ncbi:hypothetical protein [Novosphingobium sp. HII-3]|uniref:hypothetical protein n=1 Tax=Novosphingobium sp. HII-3 TaxID=2075565 RepID=UPI000CDA1CD8|nr:hypothetical protein [Novosphingobium sp. HII-3]
MSRIRSVHPGLWTDENFVCLSPIARLLFIGLWNECDDGGRFEWRPLRLKMRVLPADNVDMDAIMAELVENQCILKYEVDGASYGAVRNFCKFQRPKKPSFFCPDTPQVRTWCGSGSASNDQISEPVGNQFGTGGEIAPQKGGREEGRKEERPSVSSISDADRPATEPPPEFLPAVLEQPDDADIAFDRWQSLRSRIRPNTRALALTPPRRVKLTKRLKEIGGLPAWDRCLKSVEGSPLLRGDKTDWKAELDWLLEPKNLTKILEGNYDHDGQTHHGAVHRGGGRIPRSPIGGILAAHGSRGAD